MDAASTGHQTKAERTDKKRRAESAHGKDTVKEQSPTVEHPKRRRVSWQHSLVTPADQRNTITAVTDTPSPETEPPPSAQPTTTSNTTRDSHNEAKGKRHTSTSKGQIDNVPSRRKAEHNVKTTNMTGQPGGNKPAYAALQACVARAIILQTTGGTLAPQAQTPHAQSYTDPHRRKAGISNNNFFGPLESDHTLMMIANADEGNEIALGDVPEEAAQLLQNRDDAPPSESSTPSTSRQPPPSGSPCYSNSEGSLYSHSDMTRACLQNIHAILGKHMADAEGSRLLQAAWQNNIPGDRPPTPLNGTWREVAEEINSHFWLKDHAEAWLPEDYEGDIDRPPWYSDVVMMLAQDFTPNYALCDNAATVDISKTGV
jgi:hypothetical protein